MLYELRMGRNRGRPISESKAQGRRNEKAKGCKCQAFPGVQVFNGIFKVSSPEALIVGRQESGCELCLLGRMEKVLTKLLTSYICEDSF